MKKPQPFERKKSSVPLADLIGATIDPLLAKQGFGESSLILDWAEIVGERLAARTEPLRLQWPSRAPHRPPDAPLEPATLIIRVENGFALEVQHLNHVIIDRVNAHLGWRAVGRIALRQAPLEGKKPRPSRRPPVDRVSEALAQPQVTKAVGGIEDPALRAALTRLGTKVLAQSMKKG
jgi:hypothetical protein